MNTGGRRRPPTSAIRGLGCCALVLAVLGLWLGAASGRSVTEGHALPAVSQLVGTVHVTAKVPGDGVDAVPVEAVVVGVVVAGVLVGTRRVAHRVPVRSEARHGRAPPGRS